MTATCFAARQGRAHCPGTTPRTGARLGVAVLQREHGLGDVQARGALVQRAQRPQQANRSPPLRYSITMYRLSRLVNA